MSKETLDFVPPLPPKNYKISSAFSYNFKLALTPGYSMASYTSAVPTTYNDDHSVTFNGVTIGTNMLQRPLVDTLQLVGLNMGT